MILIDCGIYTVGKTLKRPLEYLYKKTRRRYLRKLCVIITMVTIGILCLVNWDTPMDENHVQITEEICHKAMNNMITSSEMEDLIHLNHSLIVPENLSDEYACNNFNYESRTYVHTTQDELKFPLAFSIAVYKDYQQVARLLRAIHREHNLYCLHVDRKASPMFREQINALAACLGKNVVVPFESDSTDIRWGTFATFEAFLNCIRGVLLPSHIKWRYVMTVSGSEFPLRTNWELVRIMRALNGSNMVEDARMHKQRIPKKKAHFTFNWHKGSFYMALRRELIEFIIKDRGAQKILKTLFDERSKRKFQDEIFIPTIVYNPSKLKAPGACLRKKSQKYGLLSTQYLGRYVEWVKRPQCRTGNVIRGICMMGVRHLPIFPILPHLFVNKFVYDFQPFAYDCLERWYFAKLNRERVYGHLDRTFKEDLYAKHYCVRDHLP